MTLDSDSHNSLHDSDDSLSGSVKKPRIRPIIHSGIEAPICETCQKQDFSFFDPNCPGCQGILFNPSTTIPEIFAVIRQWTPQTQQNIELLVSEIFRRGGHVNDRDGLTDMTLLHYASKSGAMGIGDQDMACSVLSDLLSQGADTDIRCRWTNMTALHYAAYFDVVPVIKLLLKATKALVGILTPPPPSSSQFQHKCNHKKVKSSYGRQRLERPCKRRKLSNSCDSESIYQAAYGCEASEAMKQSAKNGSMDAEPDVTSYPFTRTTSVCCEHFCTDRKETNTGLSLHTSFDGIFRFTGAIGVGECDANTSSTNSSVCSEPCLTPILMSFSDSNEFFGYYKYTSTPMQRQECFAGTSDHTSMQLPPKNSSFVSDIDSTCSEFDHGSSLHIASSNLSYEAVRVLLQNGANSALRDDLRRTPLDCVPDPGTFDPDSEAASMSTRLTKVLSEAIPVTPDSVSPSFDMVQSKVTLQAMGLRIGDKITVGGLKVGTLRYCGPTEFASGVWGGIELDEPVGKNDGSIGGVSYFRCPHNHGIFAPVSKICKLGSTSRTSTTVSLSKRLLTNQASKSFDKSRVTARIDTGLSRIRSSSVTGSPDHEDAQIDVGDSVIVAGQRKGTVRFVGDTKFAPGVWYGIALDKAAGRNDGSVNGERYFSCKPKHGVFAPVSRIQRLGNRQFSSEESLEMISLGNVSEKDSKRISTHSTHSAPGCLSRTPAKQIRTRSAPIPVSSITRTPGSGSKLRLQEGMTVFCNNELGVARYIGPIDFASGTWIGVELRTARGKNDGCVQGKRYFTCKPDHGVLVRPNRVSVRGISGSKLLLG